VAIQDVLNELQDFDINDLDFENIGSWPVAVKAIVWMLVFVGVIAAGYFYIVADLQTELASVEKKELDLRKEFERKAFQAANLDAYRDQMVEMEESFGSLVKQLPVDTEVPGLLEDITNKGVENGLDIENINLRPEASKEFYVELPINIRVQGSYHDFGAFVSGIASLPRIVTLHNFDIAKAGDRLNMSITARTYRYKSEGE